MSFLKQLLNPFIEFDEEKGNQLHKEKVAVSKLTQADEEIHHPLINEGKKSPEAQTQNANASSSGVSSKPLPEHEQYFEKLIDKANTENPIFFGPDFKEFINAKIDIDDISDDTLKYTTAFNILKNSGLSKEKLFSTGHEYINLIGRDLNAFLAAHTQQYKRELQQKEVDLKTKVEELQVLSQKINLLKTEINQITHEVNQTKDQLNATKNSFLLAGENKQKEIQAELDKISKYF